MDHESLSLNRKYGDLMDSFNRAIGPRNIVQLDGDAFTLELESQKIDRGNTKDILKGVCSLYDIHSECFI